MKSSQNLLLIITICMLLVSFSLVSNYEHSNKLRSEMKSKEKSKSTPQAIDLKNHYGSPSIGSLYGPKTDQYAQYVEANPETFMPFKYDGRKKIEKQLKFQPYPGYENKLKPHVIKSGDMTNIAPNAQNIVTPEMAVPKLHVEAEVHYPAEVHLPIFKGMKKEFHTVSAYDKETGRILHDKVLVERPDYQVEKKVMNIKHPHEEFINLRTGERIQQNKEKIMHSQENKS